MRESDLTASRDHVLRLRACMGMSVCPMDGYDLISTSDVGISPYIYALYEVFG